MRRAARRASSRHRRRERGGTGFGVRGGGEWAVVGPPRHPRQANLRDEGQLAGRRGWRLPGRAAAARDVCTRPPPACRRRARCRPRLRSRRGPPRVEWEGGGGGGEPPRRARANPRRGVDGEGGHHPASGAEGRRAGRGRAALHSGRGRGGGVLEERGGPPGRRPPPPTFKLCVGHPRDAGGGASGRRRGAGVAHHRGQRRRRGAPATAKGSCKICMSVDRVGSPHDARATARHPPSAGPLAHPPRQAPLQGPPPPPLSMQASRSRGRSVASASRAQTSRWGGVAGGALCVQKWGECVSRIRPAAPASNNITGKLMNE